MVVCGASVMPDGGRFGQALGDEDAEDGGALEEGGGEGGATVFVGEGVVEGDLMGAGGDGGGEAESGANVDNVALGQVGLDLEAGGSWGDGEAEEVHGGGGLHDGLEGAVLGVGDEDDFSGGDDFLLWVGVADYEDVGVYVEGGEVVGGFVDAKDNGGLEVLRLDAVGDFAVDGGEGVADFGAGGYVGEGEGAGRSRWWRSGCRRRRRG